ncbi:MAG: 3-isopropylmalate dehydratase small subunit [Promethearchaeota archaeon]
MEKTSHKMPKLKKKFGGKVLFLDRDNINTDEIIPAKYLTEIEKEPLKEHLLEDLNLKGFNSKKINWEKYGAIIARSNFGCGSSREMAAWAFEVNGINVIIATNFARIFRENAFNCGMLAIEFEPDIADQIIDSLFEGFADETEVFLEVDLENMMLRIYSKNKEQKLKFSLNKFQKDLVLYGGWVELASQKY